MSRLEKGSMEKVRQYCTGNGVPSLPLPHWTMSLTKGEVRARRFVFLRRQAYTDIACLTKRITSFDTFSFLLLFFFSCVHFPVEEKLVRFCARSRGKKYLVSIEV